MNKLVNTGGKIFYKTLLKNKVSNLFGFSGGAVMPLFDSLYQGQINYYINTHEQNCGHAATAYAKASDKTGVALVTSGPGITNMITPLLDAKNDSTPLVVFSGQVPMSAMGTNAFQEAPAVELTKHVTKWSYQVQDINEMESVIDEAFKVANNGKKGSVHIDIPKCVSYQTLTENKNVESGKIKTIDNISIEKYKFVADVINKSEKPIIYLGKGCIDAYYKLRIFAKCANIPVTSTIHGCGVYDETDCLSLRWCGMHGNVAANYGLQEADTIIAIGSRFDDRTTGNIEKYAPKAFDAFLNQKGGIIHVNINDDEINYVVNSHYNFNTTCEKFLSNMIPFIQYKKRESWLNYLHSIKEMYPFDLKTSNNVLTMESTINELYKQTKHKHTIFTTGVGNHQMQAYQFIKSEYPKKILSSGSLGVMGAGLPYAIGAQIANPKSLVIDIDGDSSFNMTLSDLKTIVEHNLPVKIAIMNNSSQMMVNIWERLFYEERYTATENKRNPNYVKLARSFGLNSLMCDNPNYLSDIVTEFINMDGPVLCEFKIEPDICLPLVGPGNALDNMILPKNKKKIELVGMAPS